MYLVEIGKMNEYWESLYTLCNSAQVDVKAVPIDQKDSDDNKKIRRLSRPDDGDLTFGGHPPPCIDIPYQVTVKDKKDAFYAISMMKVGRVKHTLFTLWSIPCFTYHIVIY